MISKKNVIKLKSGVTPDLPPNAYIGVIDKNLDVGLGYVQNFDFSWSDCQTDIIKYISFGVMPMTRNDFKESGVWFAPYEDISIRSIALAFNDSEVNIHGFGPINYMDLQLQFKYCSIPSMPFDDMRDCVSTKLNQYGVVELRNLLN